MHPLGDLQNPPATRQHTPKMAPAIPGPDLIQDQDPSLGPGPTEAHAGTTPALDPARTDAVQGADLVVGSTAAVGVIADPPCQTDADTLATGYPGATTISRRADFSSSDVESHLLTIFSRRPTQTPTTVWACLD